MRFFGKIKAVAIDGPAGSGKSTVARLTAEKLGYRYIDTGAMYRALTFKVMSSGTDLFDEESIVAAAEKASIDLPPSEERGEAAKVFLDGLDVSDAIRTMEVTVNVKHVCKLPGVRKKLVAMQRQMAIESDGAVMEGRDIGTVVLKDARHKFYIDASFDRRVERRFNEIKAKGGVVDKKAVAEDLKHRDHTDRTRDVGPLKKAPDATLIDTTDLDVEEVVGIIVAHVKGDQA